MLDINDLEETGQGEIVCQDLIDLFRDGRGGFIRGFPFGQNDGDLDKGRGVDIKVDACLSKGSSDKNNKERNDEIFFHLI